MKGVFSHFDVKTLVFGCLISGGQQDYLLNSDAFRFTDAAQSEVPLSFTLRLPPVLRVLLQLPVPDGSTLKSVPAFTFPHLNVLNS